MALKFGNNEPTKFYVGANEVDRIYLGATQVYPLWTPAELGVSLAIWFDADDASTITLNGSTVSQWDDKSGNARHATQATAVSQPTYTTGVFNGLSVLQFDGTSDFLSLVPTPQAGANQVFTIVDTTSMGTSWRNFINRSNSAAPAFYISTATANFRPSVYAAGGATAVQPSAIQRKAVLRWGFSTTLNQTLTQLDAGTEITQATGGYAIDNWISITTTLGSPIQAAAMDVGEIVVTSDLSLSERQKLEGYLAWKWGLTANLPVSHPYKSNPPMV